MSQNTTLLNHYLNFYNVSSEEELAAELKATYEQYTQLNLINVLD